MMIKVILLISLLFVGNILFAQSEDDVNKIINTSLDYIEGWYEADVNRMKRALHPELAKRKVYIDKKTGKSRLRNLSTEKMLRLTGQGGVKEVPVDKREIEINILDILSSTASVKISSVKFTDYLHLVKWNNDWVIVNVVWENK